MDVSDQFKTSQSQQSSIFQVSIDEAINNDTLEELVNKLAKSSMLIPETTEEIQSFEEFVKRWSELTAHMELLIQKADEFEKNYQPHYLESELEKELESLNEKLSRFELKIQECSDPCRCFPLNDGDYLLLTYQKSHVIEKDLEQGVLRSLKSNVLSLKDLIKDLSARPIKKNHIKGVYIHSNQPYLLDSSLFPIELLSVSSPEHFMNLLKDAHISMSRDQQNLSKSTFTIQQNLYGGNPVLIRTLAQNATGLVIGVNLLIHLSVRVLQMMGIRLSVDQLKPFVAGGLLTYGVMALVSGGPVTWPFAAIATGLTLILNKETMTSFMEHTRELLETLGLILTSILRLLFLFTQIQEIQEQRQPTEVV